MLVVQLLQPGYVDLLSAFLDSVRASHYPPELIARLLHQMEMDLPPARQGETKGRVLPGGTSPATQTHAAAVGGTDHSSDGETRQSLPTLRMRPFGDGGYTHTTLRTRRCLSGKVSSTAGRQTL